MAEAHGVPPTRWLVALMLVCLAMLPAAVAINWCLPYADDGSQPCPDPSQCCAVWGICGTGTHYCQQGNCARGACESNSPPPTLSPPPPPPSPPPPSPRPPLPRPPTPNPPSPRPPSPRPPSPNPPPAGVQSSCGAVQQDVDLFGADINGGWTVTGATLEGCCAACTAQSQCGAFTFVPGASICYLKYSTGWTSKPNTGLQSVVVRTTTAPPPATPSPATPSPSTGGYTFVPMTQDQMRRMYQLTSIFENANTNLQYAYAERLGDGRGVTYGFCGFTTGTSDGLEVVEKYTQIKPNNPLAKYLPALRALEGKGDKFTGLNGFDDAIKKLGNDQDFIKAQWDVCDTEYHEPAMQICRDIHCNYALTKAQLHDALVNHGQGLDDKFSVDYILMAAKKAVGGTPATGVDEAKWLGAFLTARYNLLYNWDRVARESVKRITMYQDLLKMGNFNLDGPIYIDLAQHTSASGGQVWQIKDVYYGKFLVNNKPQPGHKLELIQ